MWGIATTPLFFSQMRTDTFDYPHFSWDHNVNFVHYAGNWAVPVRWDLSDEDLYALLDSINGVYFAGGATELIDMETGEMSVFYKTAKRIWEYMKRQKDEKGIDWPIFGICQGFEVIHYLANEDDKHTLSNVTIYRESRRIHPTVDLKHESSLFAAFPEELIRRMTTENLALHAHDWVITTETYKKREVLSDFFKVLAIDAHQGTEFVLAVEGKKYPVSGTMFHPEAQNKSVIGHPGDLQDSIIKGKINTDTTDQINFFFSEHLRRQGSKTLDTHRFSDREFGFRMEWLNSSIGFTHFGQDSSIVTYGVPFLNKELEGATSFAKLDLIS